MTGRERLRPHRFALGLLLATLLPVSGPRAQVPGAPADWPCNQAYVPDLSMAQVWPGPDPATVEGHWAADPVIAPLVPRIASSDRPLAEVEKEIAAFAAGLPEDRRPRALTLLFAGVFELLSAERRRAVEGALRFAGHQKELAARIREESDRLFALQQDGGPPEQISELEERMQWDLRLFEDRRATTSAVCEQPELLEKRLYALAAAIARHLPGGSGE
jgi:hypothetical protein